MAEADHYFSATPGGEFVPRTITARLAGRAVTLTTAGGVFSPDRVDTGTSVLLGSTPAPPPGGDLLDLGCGYGAIACTLAARSPGATIWAVEVNERARDLCRANAERLGFANVRVIAPEDVPEDVPVDELPQVTVDGVARGVQRLREMC